MHLFLLFFIYSSSALAISNLPVDKSNDDNFEVLLRNNVSYCVAPYFDGSKYYAYELARKGSSYFVDHKWRFDVLGHISTVILDDNNN